MAFSTTEDDQWFTALPADLTTSGPEDADGEHDPAFIDPAHRYSAPTEQHDNDGDPAARVVDLPTSPPGPVWAAALNGYTPGIDAELDDTAPTFGAEPAERTTQRSWRRRHPSLAVAGSVAAAIALIGGAALVSTDVGGEQQPIASAVPVGPETALADVSTPASSTPASSTPALSTAAQPPSAQQWCAQQTGGTHISADSPDPELAAIARIEDAYYIGRDITAVNAQLGGGVTVEPGDFTAAMAAIPPGTDHCVLTSPLGPSQYRVTVIERRPGGEEKRFTSAMTTGRGQGDTTSIVGIGQVPG